MFVEARGQLQFSFVRYHLPCFFETGSLSSLELTNSIRLGVQQDLVIHMSVLSQLWEKNICYHILNFYMNSYLCGEHFALTEIIQPISFILI